MSEPTRYEIAIEIEGQRFLVSYSARRSRHCLADNLHSRISDSFIGCYVRFAGRAADGFVIESEAGEQRARMFYSGRTEREAARSPLPPFEARTC